jgi:hypothetical protein
MDVGHAINERAVKIKYDCCHQRASQNIFALMPISAPFGVLHFAIHDAGAPGAKACMKLGQPC